MHTFSQVKSVERQDNMSGRTSLSSSSASTFCIAGFLLTHYKWSEKPKSLTDHAQSDSNRERSFHLDNKQNEKSDDRRGLNTNSCHSSLKLFPSEVVTPIISRVPLIYFTSILIHSSQRYIF